MWRRKKALNQQLDSEVQYHLDRLIQDKIAAGLSEQDAKREAILEFGGPEQLKEELRDIHRLPFLETLFSNLRFAFRLIRKSPTLTATVVLTLALGIGANSAVFSAINAILLKPLPFPNSNRLMEFRQFDRTAKGPFAFGTPTRVEDWNRLNTTFQAIAGYYTSDVSDTTGSLPEKVTEALVSPRFFQVWGVTPELGRDFLPEEEHFGGPNVIIISHRLWIHRFNGDSQVIGKRLHLDGGALTVVGVMPAGFRFLDKDVDIWNPSPPDAPYAQDRNASWYYKVVGRLKADTTLAEARANINQVQSRLGDLYPKTDAKLGVEIQPLKDIFVADSRKSLCLLYGSVTLLLLIACINIAALLLARSAERSHEISIRYGLGASRATIIWQLLTECFLLALTGSSLGLFVAAAGSSLFRKLATGFPRRDEIALDWHLLLYTLVCALAVTLLSGLIPAIRGTRRNISVIVRSQVSARNTVQWVLVGAQVALAVILLIGAGLMLRSFQQLGRVSAGFETSHILTFRISGNWGETTNYKALTQRMDRTLDTIRNTPGVVSAATAALLPGIPSQSQMEINLSDHTYEQKIQVQSRPVSKGYFATMNIPVLAGKPCPATGLAVVVNRSFVKTYLGNLNPIGQQIAGNPSFEIKGVVADTREQGPNQSPSPTVYWCGSAPFPTPYFLVQTRSDPMSMAEALRQKIHLLEPARSVYGISPLDVHLSDNVAPGRLRTFLLTAFALSAVALACTGLYGTLSYFVTVRRRESGLRLALGAARSQIIASFFIKGVTAAAIGCAVGAGLSLSLTKALSGLLFGITATDWPTWLCVISSVLVIASCASFIPAAQAATVEPMQVLRDE